MITTEGKTFEQVRDEIIDKLHAQGGQCVDNAGKCVYGNAQGQHCAFGWLLPPDRDDLMAYRGSAAVMIREYLPPGLGPNDKFIRWYSHRLQLLQNAHDTKNSWLWEE